MDEPRIPQTGGAPDWTPAQLDAITTRNKTLLLSAAAGSGKTTTLTERVIRMLTDPTDPRDISRMVIVTFTVAAADDLKGKLNRALNKAIGECSDDRVRARLTEQLLLLPDADIGTIDSFCKRLVTEFADRAGLSPSFRVSDPSEETHLLHSQLAPYLDRLFAGEEGEVASAEEFCDFVSHLVESRSQEDLSRIILTVLEEVENYPEGVDKLDEFAEYMEESCNRPPEETTFGKTLLHRLFVRCRDALDVGENCLSELAGEPDSVRDALEQPLTLLLEIARAASAPTVTYDAAREAIRRADELKLPRFDPRSGFVKEGDPTLLSKIRAAVASFKDDLKFDFADLFVASSDDWKAEAQVHAKLSALLARLIRRFVEIVKEEKRRRNVASFADVERAALRILVASDGSKTAEAREVASRYDEVFVDEYQDINPIQHAIFEAISGERNRFLVGDVKQSIYSFRRANPSIFIGLKAAFPPLSKSKNNPSATVYLSDNFRCDKPIVDFTNGVFDAVFGAVGDSIGYTDDDRLRFAKRDAPDRAAPVMPVVRMFKRAPLSEGEAPPPDDEECAWVAKEIARLIANETRPDGSRIKPSDVAILLRAANGKAQAFRAALLRQGIPASIETHEDFFDSPEIRLALCLLNAVDNPRRDVPLVGLLRSPLYDFSPDLLVRIRREGSLPDLPFYDALAEYCQRHPDFEKGALFLSQLARFRRAAEGMPVDRLVLKLFTETGLYQIGGAESSTGRERLILFYQFARGFEATSFRGLYRFIAYLNDLEAEEQRFNLKPPSNANGVRIMTVHNSKGIEFPVVFVARALASPGGNKPLTRDGNVSFHPRFGLCAKIRDETGLARIDTPFRKISEYEKSVLEKEEALRVLYVALTRARERLYVTGILPGNATVKGKLDRYASALPLSRTEVMREGTFFDWIMRAVGADSPLAEITLPPPEDADAPTEPETAPLAPREGGELLSDEEVGKILKERFGFRYAFPWLRTVPGKFSVSVLSPAVLDGADDDTTRYTPRKVGEEPALPRLLSGKKKSDDPALRGTATHEFLQFCDLAMFKHNGAEVELNRLIDRGFLVKDARDLISVPELELLRATPLLDEMLAATWRRRELRFNMMLPASAFTTDPERAEHLKNQPVLVQGVMDCVFVTASDELVLLDYKTDRLRGGVNATDATVAAFADGHRDQLYYYSLALKRILGRAPDRVLLYPLCLGRPIPVKL